MTGTISVATALCKTAERLKNLTPRSRGCHSRADGDYQVTERELLNLSPPPQASVPPERIVVEQIRGNKIDYVVFTEDNVRLSQEEARQEALPPGAPVAASTPGAKPAKRCKACEKAARDRAKRNGGSSTPRDADTDTDTRAPRLPRYAVARPGTLAARHDLGPGNITERLTTKHTKDTKDDQVV